MELVIRIEDATYNMAKMLVDNNYDNIVEISLSTIVNGIPLPKGHGRIIDESQITGTFIWDNGYTECYAPTIIEADKGDNNMDRLSESISDIAYTMDCLKRLLKEIYDSGSCNDCANKRFCDYVPKAGQLVRYNCPFYRAEKDDIIEVGDEIISSDGNKVIITAIGGQDGDWCCIDTHGCTCVLTMEKIKKYNWHKTGKHYPEVVDMLNQLKGEK